ncbi:MAG: hypothetical protein ABFC62_07935 [Clostridiaceae bacterium]|nr:hypothetical protein [Eubacteriales bacterium]
MNCNPCGGIVFLTLIAGRKQKEALLDALTEAGGKLINVIYGRGSVKTSYLKDMFGLVPEENKVLITCLLAGDKTEGVFDVLVKKFRFDRPNTGVAFTIRLDRLSV